MLPGNFRADQGPSIPRAPRRADLRLAEDREVQEDGQVLARVLDLERRAPALADRRGPERVAHRRLKLAARCARRRVDAAADSSSIQRPRKAR